MKHELGIRKLRHEEVPVVLEDRRKGIVLHHAEPALVVTYKGKEINILVGFAAGSGVDLQARLVGRHLARFIPGSPSIIIRNNPGASGILDTGNAIGDCWPGCTRS